MEAAVTTVPEFPPRLSLLQVYRMYSIWEVRHEILFEMLKSPISRHSTTFRDDKLLAGPKTWYTGTNWTRKFRELILDRHNTRQTSLLEMELEDFFHQHHNLQNVEVLGLPTYAEDILSEQPSHS